MHENTIYHIAEKVNWERALSSGVYCAPTLDSEGFMHMSTKTQLAGTYEKYYKNKAGLVLLEIDARSLGDGLKWEISRPGAGEFPHLYAPLNTSAVTDTYILTEELLLKIQANKDS